MLLSIALSAAAVTTPLALSDADFGAPSFRLPERVLFDDDARPGSRWALGHSYKASVDETGMTFYPFLSPDAERHRPVHFTLTGAHVGSYACALHEPRVDRDGDSLLLDRGAVVERYRCDLESVEQIVELDLAGRTGDVRIDYRIDTDLHPMGAECAPFTFRCESGSVHIGAAFVVGEGGARIPVNAERSPLGYSIYVPADLVACAGETLVIDPAISSGPVTPASFDVEVSADIAFAGSLGFVVAVERRTNLVDSDVFLYSIDPNSSNPPTLFAVIDLTSASWASPTIASVGSNEECMVAATLGSGQQRRVWARIYQESSGAPAPPFQVSANVESYSPDLGAETSGLFVRRYGVVWIERANQNQATTKFRTLDRNGVASNTISVDFAGAVVEHDPSITATTGYPGSVTAEEFRVAFARDPSGAQLGGVFVAEVDRNAVVTTPAFEASQSTNVTHTAIANENRSSVSLGAPFLLAFARTSPGSGENVQLVLCLDNSPYGVVPLDLRAASDRADSFELRRPSLATTEEHWILTYEERSSSSSPWQATMCSGDATEFGFGIGERSQKMFAIGTPQTGTSVATRWEGGSTGSTGDLGFAVWTDQSDTRTYGGFVRPIAEDVAAIPYCAANSNSSGRRAWLSVFGDGDASSPHEIRCIDAPGGVPCFILTSRQPGFVPNVGGGNGNLCLGSLGFGRFSNALGPTDGTGTYSTMIDPTMMPQANGPVAAAPGEVWFFQAWFRDSSGGMPVSNLSNAALLAFRF